MALLTNPVRLGEPPPEVGVDLGTIPQPERVQDIPRREDLHLLEARAVD
jgi:hypothetical protein